MVINVHASGWLVTKILVDTGSSADIMFTSTFDRMKLYRKLPQLVDAALYGFGGKRVEALGKISLPMTFGNTDNLRSEFVTFDVVEMSYPYNMILGRGFLNKFKVVVHQAYLCMKMPALDGVIIVFGDQKMARSIEKGVVPGQKNVHCLEPLPLKIVKPQFPELKHDKEKEQVSLAEETKKVVLNPRDTTKQVILGTELYPS